MEKDLNLLIQKMVKDEMIKRGVSDIVLDDYTITSNIEPIGELVIRIYYGKYWFSETLYDYQNGMDKVILGNACERLVFNTFDETSFPKQ